MRKKIVVSDDEEGILALMAATLGNDERYEVLLANGGDEALRIIQREKPDLVFLDIVMPNRDGYDVCRALRADPATAHAKVVMLTALTQDSDRQKALEVGADDYLTKPFSPAALLDKVEAILPEG